MRPIIQNAVSYFLGGSEPHYSTTTDSPHDVIVSGYSYPLTENQRDTSPQNRGHRQVGILYADIADYTRLTEQDEEGTDHRLEESMKIMEAYINANYGRVVHVVGDAILAEFKDADNALNCAINMQLSDHRRNASLSPDRQIFFRIGVNFGDVTEDQSDIYGNAVNLAARLETLVHAGGICVSESVRLRLKDELSFKFLAMGKQYVKNFSDPVESFWIEFDAERVEQVDDTCVAHASAVA
jgi:class 3 adenylate cyclase